MKSQSVEHYNHPKLKSDYAKNLSPQQQTLARSVSRRGRGLHTGCDVGLTLLPAEPDTGIIFRRVDLSGFEISAAAANVAHVSDATTLMRLGVMTATVEHLLSALAGMEIDNCIAELDSLEVPIMDGSAECFVQMIEEAGAVEQSAPRLYIRVLEPLEVRDGDRRISVEPVLDGEENFSIDSAIDFSHPLIGRQRRFYWSDPVEYAEQIAPARTFGFEREIAALRNAGLIRGGSLENAVVLGEDRMLNTEPLRFEDEFARHKILDIIGDLALAGRPLIGKVKAEKSGHALHSQLVSLLLRRSDAWELVEQPIGLAASK